MTTKGIANGDALRRPALDPVRYGSFSVAVGYFGAG